MIYGILADFVLITHLSYVAFIAGGLLLIVLGGILRWNWVANFWFRITHLAAILIVTLQSWLKILCPLTTLEMDLRQKAGEGTYEETFISHWLHEFLYYNAPMWVFSICYTLFGLAVLISWIYVPPHVPWKRT